MKLRTQLLLGYTLVFALMIVIAAITFRGFTSQTDRAALVSHNHQVISKAHLIGKLLVDMETGQRGFLITGVEDFLEPYSKGADDYRTSMIDLKKLVSDHDAQVSRLEQIEILVSNWQNVAAQPEIAARRKVVTGAIDANYLQLVLSKGVGKRILDEMRGVMDQMQATFSQKDNLRGEVLTQSVAKAMVDQETAQRGFLITGKDEFLEPFIDGQRAFEQSLADLRRLIAGTSGMSTMTPDISRLEILAKDWLDQAAIPEIAAREQMNVSTAAMKDVQSMIETGTGKDVMDSLRRSLKEFIDIEENRLATLHVDSDSAATRNIILVISGTVVAIVLGIAGMLFITRNVLKQVGGEPAVIVYFAEKVAEGRLDVPFGTDERNATGIMLSLLRITESLQGITSRANVIAAGDYSTDFTPRSSEDQLGIAMQTMTLALRDATAENEQQDWLKSGINALNDKMRGDQDETSLARNIISYLVRYLGAQMGALYIAGDEGDDLKLIGSYAFSKRKNLNERIQMGEGLVGQAAFEKELISVTNLPVDYSRIGSAIGDSAPGNVVVSPFVLAGQLKGVIEVGAFKEFSDTEMELLRATMENIAINFESTQASAKMSYLLEETQRQAEELETQQEELRHSNDDLAAQSEELRSANEDLGLQKKEIERQSSEVELKAQELAISSKYKSEFLANMSHELRTPLNSLLLLSNSLSKNQEGNLTEKQVQAASIIHDGGNDLLSLINEILDLSKIEAGMMEIDCKPVLLQEVAESLELAFGHMCEVQGLTLKVEIKPGLPDNIKTDPNRLGQILKNLISNAIKFTKRGSVSVCLDRSGKDVRFSRSELVPSKAIAIVVRDTGIGIAKDKMKVIFEAFQQAEGGNDRKYGGTGLGLSISRELAKLLGGEIHLESTPGEGSTFTLYIPLDGSDVVIGEIFEQSPMTGESVADGVHGRSMEVPLPKPVDAPEVKDDLGQIDDSKPLLLLIEDDSRFAQILVDQCHNQDLWCLACATGEEGLQLATQHLPDGIILDLQLPGVDGWYVLNALKDNAQTRHIPVHIMSVEESRQDACRRGAIGFMTKPINQEQLGEALDRIRAVSSKAVKDLLVIEDDRNSQKAIKEIMGSGDVKITGALSGKRGIKALKSGDFDCVILDLSLPDMTGYELLEELVKEKDLRIPPVIVYTGKDLSREESKKLLDFADSIIIKGVDSAERLLDDTSLFLHRVIQELPRKKQKIIYDLYDFETVFQAKKVMVVDDDMRNVFAITSLLQEKGIEVTTAEDGQIALDLLEKEPEVDLVLMDIMMPVMDGYETIRHIREQEKFKNLPIVALTAKAMKEDRDRCLDAGANDYLAKPVEEQRLFSMMRIWLYQ
jgi:CheY-like chemotaxis protein